jgi:nucleoside phosphorylase
MLSRKKIVMKKWGECRSCDRTMQVRRKVRGMPAHYGLIISGNQDVRDVGFCNQWNRDLGVGVLCVGMEAAGVVSTFPCLVIRGTCNYIDSHKNSAWQAHAAIVAAVYAKYLLFINLVGHIYLTCKFMQDKKYLVN